MAKVKIILEDNETIEEAKQDLIKALTESTLDLDHDHRPFPDPVLQDMRKVLNEDFQDMYNKMFEEILIVIQNPHLQDYIEKK